MTLLAQTTTPSSSIPAGKFAFATLNASLNASATLLLVIAVVYIKKGNWRSHAYTMIAALITSAVFLICYLSSYYLFGEVSTKTMTHVPRWARTLYLIVLLPHLLAAIGMLPLIGKTLYHAYHRQWDKHRRTAKPTWAIWFYVSLSGVLVYWMLYHWMPSFQS